METNLFGYCNKMEFVPVDRILPNPYQARTRLDNMPELLRSINQYGIIEPIGVRVISKRVYELVFGSRRLNACKKLDIAYIPAIILKLSDREAGILTVEENIHKRDLNVIEKANSIKILNYGFGYNEDEISQILSLTLEDIKSYIGISKLNKDVKKSVIEHNLSLRHIEGILKIESKEEQKEIVEKIGKLNLNSVRARLYMERYLKRKERLNQVIDYRDIIKSRVINLEA